MNILIPMAGLATRFVNEGITTIKPLIKVNGKTLIEHTIETWGLDGHFIFVTRKYDDPDDNADLSALLLKLCPNSTEICISEPTRGAVETCLKAVDLIDNDTPLVITNCDQRTEWNSKSFLNYVDAVDVDGVVVTHESNDPKHSYAKTEKGSRVTELVEKKVISKDALVGIHYWRRGSDFVASARALLETITSQGTRKEGYVSETYNFLIDKYKSIYTYRIGKNEYIPLGTPYDVALYEAKIKEFLTEKPKTIFCDIDGTLLLHLHRFSDLGAQRATLLEGVLDKINQWDSIGHRIILCTARKESARAMTEAQLRELGLCWDQLIMGLTSGERVLINDKLTESANPRAVSVNLITNKGFNQVKWEKIGL